MENKKMLSNVIYEANIILKTISKRVIKNEEEN